MDFLETLKGNTNRFDQGRPLNTKDTLALRDGIFYCLERIKEINARLTPANKEMLESEAKQEEPKKRKK